MRRYHVDKIKYSISFFITGMCFCIFPVILLSYIALDFLLKILLTGIMLVGMMFIVKGIVEGIEGIQYCRWMKYIRSLRRENIVKALSRENENKFERGKLIATFGIISFFYPIVKIYSEGIDGNFTFLGGELYSFDLSRFVPYTYISKIEVCCISRSSSAYLVKVETKDLRMLFFRVKNSKDMEKCLEFWRSRNICVVMTTDIINMWFKHTDILQIKEKMEDQKKKGGRRQWEIEGI